MKKLFDIDILIFLICVTGISLGIAWYIFSFAPAVNNALDCMEYSSKCDSKENIKE